MVEHLILGWKNIREQLLRIEGSDPPKYLVSLPTLIMKYGPELKRAGAVFEWYQGSNKRKVIACWPSVFMRFFIVLQQKKYGLKKNNMP